MANEMLDHLRAEHLPHCEDAPPDLLLRCHETQHVMGGTPIHEVAVDDRTCEGCDLPGTDADPLVDCEHYGLRHDSCHLVTCQSTTCHKALYGESEARAW